MGMSSRALFAAASLTILGFTLGVAGDRVWLAHRHAVAIGVDTGHSERFHALMDELGLSDSQRVEINGILSHYQANVEQTWQSLQPRLQPTMDSARHAIEGVLDQGQLAMFGRWLEREHQRMHGTEHPGLRH